MRRDARALRLLFTMAGLAAVFAYPGELVDELQRVDGELRATLAAVLAPDDAEVAEVLAAMMLP